MTRVELHGSATWQDYQVLHERMEAEGYRRVIQDSKGAWYHLPPAEYELKGTYSLQEAFTKADRAAGYTRKGHDLIVTESAGQLWRLRPVTR
jgi:hypothetical protein